MTDTPSARHPETAAAQGLAGHDAAWGGVVPPIQPSTTFARDAAGELTTGDAYQRDHSPTIRPAEDLLAHLDGGEASLLFGSGMAAATAVVRALRPGDHIVAQRVMYWGLRRWLSAFCAEWGLGLTVAEPDADSLAAAIRPGETAVVWVETPANPTWETVDIARVAEAAHGAGASVVVDNTVPTPVHCQPLALGADLVFTSATKGLNGHSDVLAGGITARDASTEHWARIRRTRRQGGAMPGPFEAWLLLRGMRTLYVRMDRASATAATLAERLGHHPAVREVRYPGRPETPGHEVARRQMGRGFGAMLSLRLNGGAEAADRMVRACRTIQAATSLGGVESLIEHRQPQEGPESPTPPDLVRLSVGLEHPDDLISDLERALAA